jgi:glycosyltransferase involved in cell wall biosynthesis
MRRLRRERNFSRKNIVFLQTTAASLSNLEKNGLLPRQKKLFRQYMKTYDVVVFSSDIRDYTTELGIPHRRPVLRTGLNGLDHLLYFAWLVFRARSLKGTIIVSGVSLPVLRLLKMLSGQKVIIYYKYDWGKGVKRDYGGVKGLVSSIVEKLSIRSADQIICTADWLKDIICDRYGRKAVVNPNSVDEQIFHPALAKGETVIYAGRLHWSKGVDTLIEAFARLEQEQPYARLMICGQGEERERLQSLAASSRAKNVEFPGLIDQVTLGRLIAESKAFVLPTSTMEGHPKALIEAMACGTACVVSDVPGNHHIIEHMKNGLLFAPGDKDALFSMLQSLFCDEKFRKRLEDEAVAFARKHFSFSVVVEKELHIIQEVLAGQKSR